MKKVFYSDRLKIIQKFLLVFLFILNSCTVGQHHSAFVEWDELNAILKNIQSPVFPGKEFNITNYGAIGNGISDCTDAFRKAITECSNSGGGKVVVPSGVYVTGAIHLKSNVNLVISKDATVKFTQDKKKYLPVVFTRWEGVECYNYSPLIYAYGQENIAITGEGILDGQGSEENWWSWKKGTINQKQDRDKLFEMGENSIPVEQRVFGDNHFLRPNFFQPYKCKNVLVEGVKFINSPMWFLNPVLCENVIFNNVTVEGLGPNNDGCDPECSKNVLIKNCFFNTGDDCIAIKSGRNNDGRRINVPSENIIVQDCIMKEGHGGVVIGSEISGGVKNVFIENCKMDSPNLERALRFKTNSIRGGVIENIYARNISVGEVSEAVIKVDYYYEEGDKGNYTPVIRNLKVQNLQSKKSQFAIWIKAYQRSPLTGFELSNCQFNNVEKDNVFENVSEYKFEKIIINEQPFTK